MRRDTKENDGQKLPLDAGPGSGPPQRVLGKFTAAVGAGLGDGKGKSGAAKNFGGTNETTGSGLAASSNQNHAAKFYRWPARRDMGTLDAWQALGTTRSRLPEFLHVGPTTDARD